MIKDYNGEEVNIGDKVYGEGFLSFQDGFKIDLSPAVTVREVNGKIFFGALSKESFRIFYKVKKKQI